MIKKKKNCISLFTKSQNNQGWKGPSISSSPTTGYTLICMAVTSINRTVT